MEHAGTLVNKAILTAGRPEGDVLWGLDNTLLSRALSEDVFVPYESTELGRWSPRPWRSCPATR